GTSSLVGRSDILFDGEHGLGKQINRGGSVAMSLLSISDIERQRKLLATAGRVLAGGGLGLFNLPDEVNLVIAEGKGSHVTDVAGRDYIDYHLGSGPALLGHA